MRNIFKIFIASVLLLGIGCSDAFDLDLQVDPNNPTPESADLPSLYNNVQLGFAGFAQSPQFFGSQLARHRAFTAGTDYPTAWGANAFDGVWTSAYANFIPDADAVIDIASQTGQLFHTGTAKIMKAYVLMTLVDLFGNVPLSQAGQGLANLGPVADSGADVYAAAGALLDEGIADLTANEAAAPTDLIYGQDGDKWIAAANSLKLRSAVTTRDAAAFNALVTADSYITSSDADFEFPYGSNRNNPDSRHPFYQDSYESGDGAYQSNWLMWTMANEKATQDPRIRGYFWRQAGSVPLDDDTRFDCIWSILPDPAATPAHYTACNTTMPYCAGDIGSGYYGRDHGNGNGIPPDGDIRTLYGVYPGGGMLDIDRPFTIPRTDVDLQGTWGALGAGIHPIWPSFFSNFYKAEMYAVLGDDASARAELLAGVQASIDKVVRFMSRDADALTTVVATNPVRVTGADFVPDATQIQNYIDEVAAIYDNAGDKLDVIAKEFLIATYGNGMEGYNLIRRTARPLDLQPAILTTAGTFVRSALYPAVYVNLNENATQKTFYDQVFWDTNPADLGPCFN